MNITDDMIMSGISKYTAIEQLARFATDVTDAEDARRELDIVKAMVEYGCYASVRDYEDNIFKLCREYCITAYDSSIKISDNTSIKYNMLI